jgi:hypothetical protein
MDKFNSKVHRVHMELGGKLLNFLRIKTQLLERFQSVSGGKEKACCRSGFTRFTKKGLQTRSATTSLLPFWLYKVDTSP